MKQKQLTALITAHLVTNQRLKETASFPFCGNTISSTEEGASVQLPDGSASAPIPVQGSGWHAGTPPLVLVPEGNWGLASVLGRAPYISGGEEPPATP